MSFNKDSRIKNSVRNVTFGLAVTIINTLVSFVTRTVMVKELGTEVLGINGLFNEIISMLSLAELGVGMAIVYSLYKPISEQDTKKISQLMTLYRTAYHIIAIVTLLLGIVITPFVDKLITDINFPLSYIRIVFILFVIQTSSTYLFSYKTSLVNADQKQYIVSLANALVKIAVTILIVIALIVTKNYIIYLILLILQSLASNIIMSIYVDRKYPYLDYKERLGREEKKNILSNIKNIFIKRVSGVVTSSTDNILISTLVSTLQVGLYSNYVMIFSVMRTMKQQLTNGIAASIGNLRVTSDSEHCVAVLNRLTYMYYIYGLIAASGLMAVSKSFITIWLGTDYVMEDLIVYVAIFNLFLEICCSPLWQYLEVSGLFKQDKNIGIIGSVVNLIVSIYLGKKIGITGIFLGTVCTQMIQMILKTFLIFKKQFYLSPIKYFIVWGKIFITYALLIIIQLTLFTRINISNLYFEFLIKGILSVLIAVLLSIISFIKSDELTYCFELAKSFIKNKKSLSKM